MVTDCGILLPDPAEREAFRQQKRTVQTERQTPLLYYARNFEDEKQMLYQIVREQQLMNDRIAILFSQNRQVFGFTQGLTEVGMEVEVHKQRSGNNSLVGELSDALVRAWSRNRSVMLAGFRVDERGRMIGESWVPKAGLTASEFQFALRHLAEESDRFEFQLTGRDQE